MSNINKIKVSGTTYSIQDLNATKTVELTQAEYDALSPKDPNVFYIITDATAGNLSNYYTKSETSGATEISTALASKQTTLTAGTGISIVDNVISATGGGGSMTIDTSLDSGSTNAVANSAITNAINDRQLKREYVVSEKVFESTDNINRREIIHPVFRCYSNNSTNTELVLNNKDLGLYFPTVNGKKIFSTNKSETNWLGNVIEESAITTTITSSSTDSQVPSAKAVYDKLGGLKLVKLTQSEYDSLTTKDNSTLFVIVN